MRHLLVVICNYVWHVLRFTRQRQNLYFEGYTAHIINAAHYPIIKKVTFNLEKTNTLRFTHVVLTAAGSRPGTGPWPSSCLCGPIGPEDPGWTRCATHQCEAGSTTR